MKTKLLALVLLVGGSAFAAPHVFFGVGVGVGPAYGYYAAPAPIPAAAAYIAPAPGPGYTWIPGYYYPAGPRRLWHAGYWVRPPYPHAVWVGPRWYGGRYYRGYWRR